MTAEQQIPEGYLANSRGHLVDIKTIKPMDLERNELVIHLAQKARALQNAITEFKRAALGDVQAFQELSAEKYNAKIGGAKGNLSLPSFDGRIKVQRVVAEYILFDERLGIAKSLIDECLNEWTSDSRPEIRALIEQAFETDREGNVSTSKILGLRRHNFDHPKWREAMEAIADSIQVSAATTYLRIYERVGDSDQFEQIVLDIAKL